MATTTPNFGWTVPTSSDLVKNGATAIETLGDAIDASLVDLKGGTTGQVLAKASGTDLDFTWATVTSGMTLVRRASFNNVADTGTTFDDVFDGTYKTYMIVIERLFGATASDDAHFQLRYAGPNTQAVNYFGQNFTVSYLATSTTFGPINNVAQFTFANLIGSNAYPMSAVFYINGVGDSSGNIRARWYGMGSEGTNAHGTTNFAGFQDFVRNYTGFILKSSSSNITGEVSIYGLAI